jgi:hypothetical protein
MNEMPANPLPATPPQTPTKSGRLGKLILGIVCLLLLIVVVVGLAFRGLIGDFIKDVRTDHTQDTRVVSNQDKNVEQATFQKVLDYIDGNVPEIKQQQSVYHQKKNTGIRVSYTLQGLEVPPPNAPDRSLVMNYHWVYVSFWFHNGVFDDKQLWSWTFLVKKDFSELQAYDSEKDTFLKIREWQNDIERIRKYMALADKN